MADNEKKKVEKNKQPKKPVKKAKKAEPKVEIVEAGSKKKVIVDSKKTKQTDIEHVAKAKPKLTEERKIALAKRSARKKNMPKFRRQEWFRYKKLGTHWRKPRGLTSKARQGVPYRTPVVKIGYRTPKDARDLHPSGFEEVLVHNIKEMWNVKPEIQAVRIGGSVGAKKRIGMIAYADDKGIRILNRYSLKIDRAIDRIEGGSL